MIDMARKTRCEVCRHTEAGHTYRRGKGGIYAACTRRGCRCRVLVLREIR